MRTIKNNLSTIIILTSLLAFYAVATLPYLSIYPQIETAQMMISAPAHKLATEGVFGSDMYRGFFEADAYNYDHMPLYALPMTAVFKLFGTSILNARLLSVFYGAVTILLTFWLGKRLYNSETGLMAAAALCILRLGHLPEGSGIPLFDIARVIRFDILVPVWVLSATLVFHWAYKNSVGWGYFLAGLLSGLAGLTHVYGFFILPAFVVLLLWQEGWRLFRQGPLYLLGMGWATAVSPYILYITQNPAAYQGQMLRHRSRLNFSDPQFYIDNLLDEPFRFLTWLGGSFHPVLWPRIAIWLFIIGIATTNILLFQQLRQTKRFEDRLLWVTLPILWLLLAALIHFKRYVYIMLLMPFFALQLGYWGAWLWAWSREKAAARAFLTILLALTLFESGWGVARNLQNASQLTSYNQLTAEIKEAIPPKSRLLASGALWMGLRTYDFYSLDLAFVQTAARFEYDPTPTVAEVMDNIAPEYIIVREDLLKLYIRTPEVFGRAELIDQWRGIDQYIAASCSTLIQKIDTTGYGPIVIYRC